MIRCTGCGFENPAGMRFCGNCGSPLGAPAREERKLVTLLFADVVGSTQIAATVDPERLHAQMQRFFAVAQEEIERFGGTVEKFIGDAVAAVFGLPTVHEDDAERAARAALAIRRRTAPEIAAGTLPQVRMGVNTGEIVANPRGLQRGEFLMTGEAVNLAARLQQHATPDQILLGERTAVLLRSRADLRPLPPIAAKGFGTPIPVWELLSIGAPQERELRSTAFVGRGDELTLLDSHLRRTRRESRGHAVTILGPAGVGKTRLVHEFRQRADGVHVLRGRALAYGTGVPFWALGEAIREECGIFFGDSLEVARSKLQQTTARLEIPQAAPALQSVLALADPGADLAREELFAGMRTLFQALAREQPLLLIFEDIHSAEDVTLDYLEQAADWSRQLPILLLLLARPELLERRPQWMGGKRSATTIVLDALNGEESRALVDAILGGRPVPPQVLELLLRRADGNPLFLEEILRGLIEQGILADRGEWILTVPPDELTVPDTVHAVIAARVDALPAVQKQVLQAAAVMGKDFWLGAVRDLTASPDLDDAAAALVAKELLIHKIRSVLRGEEEFTFRHILIRDVAYATIAKQTRAEMHRHVALWMTRVAGDREAEFADFIAHHWLQVVHLRRELGLPAEESAVAEAIAKLSVAGDRAARVYANATALDHCTKALDLAPPEEIRLPLLERRGQVWMLLGQHDRAREDFQLVHEAARRQGDAHWEALALDDIGLSYRRQDRIGEALEHLDGALRLSRTGGDAVLSGRILNHLGFTYFTDGRYVDSVRAHEEAKSLLQTSGQSSDLAESFHGLGDGLVFTGRFEEAIQSYAEAIRISDAIGNRSLTAESQFMTALARQKTGRYEAADEEVGRAVRTLEEIGDVWNLAPALITMSLIARARGDLGRGLAAVNRALQHARQVQSVRFTVYCLRNLARLSYELEDIASAWKLDNEAAALAPSVGGTWLPVIRADLALDTARLGRMPEALAELARAKEALASEQGEADFAQEVTEAEASVHLLEGRADDADRTAVALLDLAARTGTALHWTATAFFIRGAAAAAMEQPERALEFYQTAALEAERAGRPTTQWRALAGQAEVHRTAGRQGEAADAARRAKEIIGEIAATVTDERLRATFLQSAPVQLVTALAGL